MEQRGCKKNYNGCKDQFMINNAILEDCYDKKKNLSTAWIDYKKAFDSVPHSWILKCIQLYKVHPIVSRFIECSMKSWKTNMALIHTKEYLRQVQSTSREESSKVTHYHPSSLQCP